MPSYIDLLVSERDDGTLESMAAALFELIPVADSQERESSNYVDGHYFLGRAGNTSYLVCISDSEDHDDLPFWMQVSSEAVPPDQLRIGVDELVREKLLPAGFRIARVERFGRLDEMRFDY